MKTLIFLLCCALVVKSSWCDGISIIGSRYIRPNRPYTVAFANPLNKSVNLKLSLYCTDVDDNDVFKKESKLKLSSTAGKNVQFSVPSIANTSNCIFKAINDDGNVVVNHEVTLEIPKKTVSIFILTDKPVYKPGDELRFRVVVVDIETKPVTKIPAIEVLIDDKNGNSVRQWKFAKLNNGVFETSYQMAAEPVLGTWTITVKVKDGSILNEKTQSFEVMRYVLPKFAVKVWPTHTLLIDSGKISLNVESYYTFGQRVDGDVHVQLYLEKYSNKSSIEAKAKIYGKAVVDIPLKKKLSRDENEEDNEDYVLVKMTAAVKDSITNATVNITQNIPVYLKPYKISLVKTSLYYRPRKPYHFKVSVKDHSGLPVGQGKTITIMINGDDISAALDGRGLASFVIPAPDDTDGITVTAEFDSVDYGAIGDIPGLESSSMQYIKINPQGSFKISKKSTSFTISSNEPFIQFTYCIVSRGSIVDFGHIKLGSKKKTYPLKLKLTEAMSPKATLMVFFVKDGHLIKDFFDMDFESFGNNFEFRLDKTEGEPYRPDEEIYVEGTAQKDSTIFFQAIDESALLLGHTEYGLTKQGILDDLDQYRGEGRDNEIDWYYSMGLFFKNDAVDDDSGSSRAKRSPYFGQRKERKVVLLRLDFPEAWLWKNISMNNRNSFEIQEYVPDTITSWHVTGFALSQTRGLGIMDIPLKYTVGKPFYMIAHLPYSIKRGEVALIQVTLYNFLGNTVTTDVTLFNKNDEIEFVEKSSKDDSRRSKAVILPSHQVKAVSFMIKAKKLGEIAIKIEAENTLASDGLEHMLRVTPESRLYEKNEARFIELPNHMTRTFDFNIDIPRDTDPGSIRIQVTFDHDLIGIPATHSESLINIPNGSGDLNLLTLVPNIVALDYLSSTDKTVDETVEQKAIDYLNKGYDNQLKYKSSNGAFRQWINARDENKESIFLTALVANTFITASKWIEVNRTVIKDAFSWLAGKQKSDGCFDEIGEVLYYPMQDNSTSVPLTAFVVAAIMENHNFSIEFEPLVNKAVQCLANKYEGLSSDYHRALATYALSLAKHEKRFDYLNKLVEHSERSSNKKERYWNEGSLSVEIAGYALLSYIIQDLPMQGLAIYSWLNKQRYSSGEFSGVQSTFVGLKAMSRMAQILTSKKVDYRVQIISEIKGKLPKRDTFEVRSDVQNGNALSTTPHSLLDTVRKVQVKLEGIGYGYFQLSYQYHYSIALAKKQFDLTTELLSGSNHEIQKLKVCLRFVPPESYLRSNKAVVEIFLPSGLVVNDDAVEDLSSGREIKNTIRSTDGSAMYVFYDSMGANTVCFKVTARRQFKIANHQPAYVVVYDTENRDHFGFKTYEGIVLQPCDICEDEDCTSLKC